MGADFIGGDDPSALPGQQSDPVPAVGGDMQKATYDPNNDGKVTSAEFADEAGHSTSADTADAVSGAGAAGINHYWGTDGSGAEGWHSLPIFDPGTAYLASALSQGVGVSIIKDILAGVLRLKSLVAGSNITIDVGTDTLTINSTAGGGGVTDGDKGDVVVSGGGTTWTIDTNAVSNGKIAADAVTTVKILNDNVTNAKLANMATATFKGRTTAGTGDPEDLTATQATALLNAFTATLKGLVPPPTTATGKYLKDNGTWDTPAGGGGSVAYINNLTSVWVWGGGNAYIHAASGCPARVTVSLSADDLVAYPFVPGHNLTVVGLGCYVRTAGTNLRIGIFASDAGDGTPTTHLGSVTIAAGSIGTKMVNLGASVALTAGTQYWLVFNVESATGLSAVPIANAVPIAKDIHDEVPATLLRKSYTYAAAWTGGLSDDWLGNQFYTSTLTQPVVVFKV